MADILAKAGSQLLMVTIVGLLLGSGLPVVFSLGMRALTAGRPTSMEGHEVAGRANPLALSIAILCFAIVVAAVLFGIAVIIWGKRLLG
ncbi:MAG: hypothetical protein M0Z51_10695 [Propionibacterium sp.]|nr:hypothetical protein [Propionibacterium sp.]